MPFRPTWESIYEPPMQDDSVAPKPVPPPIPAAPPPLFNPKVQRKVDAAGRWLEDVPENTGAVLREMGRRAGQATVSQFRDTALGQGIDALNPELTGDPLGEAERFYAQPPPLKGLSPAEINAKALARQGGGGLHERTMKTSVAPGQGTNFHYEADGTRVDRGPDDGDGGGFPAGGAAIPDERPKFDINKLTDSRDAIRAQAELTDWNPSGRPMSAFQMAQDDRARGDIEARHRRRSAEIEAEAAQDDPVRRTMEGYKQTDALNDAMPSRRGGEPQPFKKIGENSYITNPDEEPRMSVGDSRAVGMKQREMANKERIAELKNLPEEQRQARWDEHVDNYQTARAALRAAQAEGNPQKVAKAQAEVESLRADLKEIFQPALAERVAATNPYAMAIPAAPPVAQ